MLISKPIQRRNQLALRQIAICAEYHQSAWPDPAFESNRVLERVGRCRHRNHNTTSRAFRPLFQTCYVGTVLETIVAVVSDLLFHVKIETGAKQAGRAVRFATTLDQAVRYAREARAVLLVVDLNCKTVDVIALVKDMKSDPELSQIPVLGFVSHVQEDRKREALAAGFDRVVARSTFSDRAAELLSPTGVDAASRES